MVTVLKKGSDKSSITKILSRVLGIKGLNAYKYCGVIHLKEDALSIQKKLRNEWK